MKFRPWGNVEWVLSLSDTVKWDFIGTIGTEDRSITAWKYFKNLGVIKSEFFSEILDIESPKYAYLNKKCLQERRSQYSAGGGDLSKIKQFGLTDPLYDIQAFAENSSDNNKSIILDITSYPKRFFFPILRHLAKSDDVENLIVTYTSPQRYAEPKPLYEDIEPWTALPGFCELDPDQKKIWIISVGFLVESLSSYVGDNQNEKMCILIPFPASLSVLRRTWESVANLERAHTNNRFSKYRVETFNLSAAFDQICSLAQGAAGNAIAFAPFGPKPTSAAMCLYASSQEASVHYPQPLIYNPDYSKGILDNDPEKAVNAYWIKHKGTNFYSV